MDMKQKFLKCVVFFIILAMCLNPATILAGQIDLNASYYLTEYSAYIWPEGGGEISIWFDVTGKGTMDEVGVLTIILQESSDRSTWNTVKTFRHTSYSNMLEYNSVDCASGVYYSGNKGKYYRAYVTVWAGRDGDGDSRQILTDIIQA